MYQWSEINKSLQITAPNIGKIITMTTIESGKKLIKSKLYPELQLSSERKLWKDFIANHLIYSQKAAMHV